MLKLFNKKNKSEPTQTSEKITDKISIYKKNGSIPWSEGYVEYKIKAINETLTDSEILKSFEEKRLPNSFGIGLDERIVEYPWIFSILKDLKNKEILDAGSTFNFEFILEKSLVKENKLTIATYAPENPNFNHLGISYVYTDLRNTFFRDLYFDVIVSHSTIEHIDMDNSIYGYEITHLKDEEKKSYEYLSAVNEFLRILKPNGTLILTFPFGKFENHGFFQQFDTEMVDKIITLFKEFGTSELCFFKYLKDGWKVSSQEECSNSTSYNPHTGRGKGEDGAAHCRGICCIKFTKN